MTSTAKKMITPKQKNVTCLSVTGPASPTPFAASALGAPTKSIAQAPRKNAKARFTSANLAHPAPGAPEIPKPGVPAAVKIL